MTPNQLANLLRGLVFGFLCFITAFLGSIFILIPCLPFLFIKPRLWRLLCDTLVGFWLSYPVSLMEFLYGIKFQVSGDLILPDKPALIIMNHRTRLDWMFLWSALYKMAPSLLTTEKISLKRMLKNVPGAGWAMECNGFIFLERKWDVDQQTLDNTVFYLANIGRKYQLLLFPEGTDRCPDMLARSHQYARKNGLTEYNEVLHPRTTGFTYLLERMRVHGALTYVYDVTIAYPDHIPQTEMDFATGIVPREVHFHVDGYSSESIPTEEGEVADWLTNLWAKKETTLRQFYASDDGKKELPLKPAQRRWDPRASGQELVGLWVSLLFWTLTSAMWIYFWMNLTLVRYYCALSMATFWFIGYKYKGVERLAIQLFQEQTTNAKQQ